MGAWKLDEQRAGPSDWLLLVLIATLPIMKPSVSYPMVLPDLIFLLLVASLAVEFVLRRRRVVWHPSNWVPIGYVASLAPSLLASASLRASLIKLVGNIYLATLAILVPSLLDSRLKLRRAITTWIGAAAMMALLAPVSLAAFYFSPNSWLLDYTSYDFGSLPPGNYPRLALTFINANMMCNYLIVSLGLVLIARRCEWLSHGAAVIVGLGILFAAFTSLSPGLGGIALLAGVWIWLSNRESSPKRAKLALATSALVACIFILALAFAPIVYPSAPFLVRLPLAGIVIAPSGRFLTWTSAAQEFARHPLIGHGIGIGAASVRYPRPDGFVEHLTDAHNSFLNIAAQAGVLGLFGLLGIVALAVVLTGRLELDRSCIRSLQVGLGLSFLIGFVYQGLGGSFEDTRHLWVLLGLLLAANRLSPRDGNSRTAGEPSSG
jgi:O-antigen ligase